MRFTIFQDSRPGDRRDNEDRVGYAYAKDVLLMVIADGMGGHLHGEVAAQIASQFIAEAFQRNAQPRLADPLKFLLESITNAHHAIVDYANTRGADKIMYAGYYPMGLSLERIFTEMPDVPFRDHVWAPFLRENALRVFKRDA